MDTRNNIGKLRLYCSPGESVTFTKGDERMEIRVDDVNRKADNIRLTIFADKEVKIGHSANQNYK